MKLIDNTKNADYTCTKFKPAGSYKYQGLDNGGQRIHMTREQGRLLLLR